MINVAVLGLGRIGPSHARTVQQNPRASLVAIAEADQAKLERVAGDFPGVRRQRDYRDVLESPDVQAVIIALPHWLHEQAAVDAVQAGKHVLIEKPLANSVEECERIVAAVSSSRIKFMVGHTQHFYPIVAAAKRLLDAGEIGRLIMGIDSWYKPLEPEKRPSWMLDRKLGGGMMLMDGVHMIDRLLWHVGARVMAVKAMNGNPVYPEIPADDTAMAFLQFENGVVATLSRIAYRTGVTQYGADYFGTNGQLKYRLPYGQFGENGLWVGRDESWRPVDVERRNSLADQFDAFLDCVENDTEPPVSVHHGLEVIRVMDAIERSAATGREVVIDR